MTRPMARARLPVDKAAVSGAAAKKSMPSRRPHEAAWIAIGQDDRDAEAPGRNTPKSYIHKVVAQRCAKIRRDKRRLDAEAAAERGRLEQRQTARESALTAEAGCWRQALDLGGMWSKSKTRSFKWRLNIRPGSLGQSAWLRAWTPQRAG